MPLLHHHRAWIWTSVGALIALSNTVNTMLASILNPLIGAITAGKGTYV